MIKRAQKILQNQRLKLTLIFSLIAFFTLIIGYLILSDPMPNHGSLANYHSISLPSDKVDAQEMWMNQIDNQNKRLDDQNKLFEQKLKYFESLILEQKQKEVEVEKEKHDLKKEIGHLKQELKNVENKTNPSVLNTESILKVPVEPFPKNFTSFTQDPFINKEELIVEEAPRPPLNEIVMGQEDHKKKTHHVNEHIFAGTTVKALLISSVDAVCGVFSNSDPIPVKLRILDDGHLPKHIKAKLKGGIIIGSAYGNLSNERVYIRLERMSLINPSGEGIEMEVAGYVSGNDGRFGLRGEVIDKSTKIVKNAAYSGVLSGTGQVLQSAVSKKSVNYPTEVLTQGCATGAGNAFDMLSDYYIRRAEQVQPVLQVNAGIIVDITFTYGASLGDVHIKEQIKKTRLRNKEA